MDTKEFIFNKYKEDPLISKTFKKEIMEKYHVTLDEARDLFVRINNYQVKKYGKKVDTLDDFVACSSIEEKRRVGNNAIKRKYYRRGK